MIELGMEGQEAEELAALERDLGLNEEEAQQVLGLIGGDLDPKDFVGILGRRQPTGNGAILYGIDAVIEGYGIESVALEQDEYGYAPFDSDSFQYVNTGDVYNATVVLYQGGFYLTTWGDAYEEWKIESEDDDDDEDEDLF